LKLSIYLNDLSHRTKRFALHKCKHEVACVMKSVATLLWESVKMKLTLLKLGLGNPLGLPKLQSSIAGVKTLHIGVFFISLEIYQSVECRCWKWACMGHLDICSTSYGKKKGRESNWQFDSWPLKVRNWLDPGACRWSAIHR